MIFSLAFDGHVWEGNSNSQFWVLIPFQLLLFAILWKPTPVIHYVCRLGTKVNIISPCLINHPNICRTSHWRILRGAVECISYSVGRWRMCNPIAPQLSLRQVPLLVVWQLLALSVGAGASNHRFCWSVISSYMHVIFSLPKILLLPLCWVECWIAKIVGLRLCGWTLPHLYTRKVLRLGLGKCGIRIWIARVFIQIVLNLNCIALTAHDRSPIRLVTFSVGPKWHTRKW